MDTSARCAQSLDHDDPLAAFRSEFHLPEGRCYLDGNSLGPLSHRAERMVQLVIDDWKTQAIDGWLNGREPWFHLAERVGALMAPLVGAFENEVVATGSTTVNLHQLVATLFKPTGTRTRILADELAFSSDIYALQSQLQVHGLDPRTHLVRVVSRDGHTIDESDVIAQLTDDVAMVVLPSVLYRSGQLLDIRRISDAAHARGIVAGFDLAHSVGAVPHALHDWGVDFAFWCTYKYLNGGPGSVGGLFINSQYLGRAPGLAGWFSSDKSAQFDLAHRLQPADTAGAFQIGTPHVLSLAPLLGTLEMFVQAGLTVIRAKSLALTRYLMDLADAELAPFGFTVMTPREDERRGGHVALAHPEAARITKALKANGVIPDFRAPHIVRLAPAPLYTSFGDVWNAVQVCKRVMQARVYERYENRRDVVA